jgi:predicted RNA binding protein YcfA (HicA-like mRNA interferase family)
VGRAYSSREILRLLQDDGWYEVNCEGDHHQFKHPTKPGRVTLPHPKKDLGKRVVGSIFRQAGWKRGADA